jgi:hypothetical protein
MGQDISSKGEGKDSKKQDNCCKYTLTGSHRWRFAGKGKECCDRFYKSPQVFHHEVDEKRY